MPARVSPRTPIYPAQLIDPMKLDETIGLGAANRELDCALFRRAQETIPLALQNGLLLSLKAGVLKAPRIHPPGSKNKKGPHLFW